VGVAVFVAKPSDSCPAINSTVCCLKARGLDFYNDNGFWAATPFIAMPTDAKHPTHLSGPPAARFSPNAWFIGHAAQTFNKQNTIAIGAAFDSLRPPEKNLTIVHEVLHLYFDELNHVNLAKDLDLGTFKTEDAATKAIDDWLGSDCGHKKKQ
jgi:hypothetical protein